MGEYRILAFVGNGFDISALNKFGDGVTTSYSSFYNYFMYRYPQKNDNALINQMRQARANGRPDWSDFEALLAEQIADLKDVNIIKQLNLDLADIQNAFSRFLNEIVDSDVIDRISMMDSDIPAKENKHACRSLSRFLGDLSESQYNNLRFHNMMDNHDKVHFSFINFNYTALLDNYIYLDKEMFDPAPHISSDNNFTFYTNPNNYINHTGFSNPYCRLITKVYHPHGYQDIPKSLLFGTETDGYDIGNYDPRRKFIKSIWAQSEELYGKLFDDTRLFIIYGCSLGKSDNWWWRKLFDSIAENDAELIIYMYGDEDEAAIKDKFICGCCLKDEKKHLIDKVKENIYVISFIDGSNLSYLQF